MNTPFVHLFHTPIGKFVYDVNTNQILEIDSSVYNSLNCLLIEKGSEHCNDFEHLKSQGYFSSKRSSVSKHPDTDYIEYYLNSHLSTLTLQVTQQCNF